MLFGANRTSKEVWDEILVYKYEQGDTRILQFLVYVSLISLYISMEVKAS